MDLIDEKELDIEKTFATFDKHRKDFEERAQIMGFNKLEDDDDDEEYGDEGYPDDLFPPGIPVLPRRFR
jgi:hypothetical protein